LISLCLVIMALVDTTTVTSEEWNDLNYDTTGYWVPYEGGWVIVTSDYSQQFLTVWVWPEGEEIRRFLATGPREGFWALSAATMMPDTNILALRCMLTGRVFSIDLGSPEPEFERTHHAPDLAGDMIFWDRETLIGGAHPTLSIKQYGGNEPLKFLNKVKRLLPDDSDHPSSKFMSTHQLKMSRHGNRLIVSYALYPKYLDFEIGPRVKRKTRDITFRGYQEPPDKYIGANATKEETHAYFVGFHHLREISWYRDRPIARFKKGFTTYGVWVDLDRPEFLTRDNEAHQEKIFAVGNNEFVMATLSENDEGIIECTLWRQPSLSLP